MTFVVHSCPFVVQKCFSCVSWFPPSHRRRRAAESPREARTRAPTTHYPLPSPPFSLLLEAHCIVSTHYPLLSTLSSLLDGSPLHSGHALPSALSSLLPTLSFPCGSNISPCKEEAVGVEDSGLSRGDCVNALWERGGDPSTGEWSERAGDRRLDRTRL